VSTQEITLDDDNNNNNNNNNNIFDGIIATPYNDITLLELFFKNDKEIKLFLKSHSLELRKKEIIQFNNGLKLLSSIDKKNANSAINDIVSKSKTIAQNKKVNLSEITKLSDAISDIVKNNFVKHKNKIDTLIFYIIIKFIFTGLQYSRIIFIEEKEIMVFFNKIDESIKYILQNTNKKTKSKCISFNCCSCF
jgi:hypothetical protein